MLKLNKHMLLVLTVLMMLVLIPTAFASSIDDAGAVGVTNQSTEDSVSAIPDEMAVESVEQSDVDEKLSALDDTGVLKDDLRVGITITPTPNAVDNYDGSTKNINVDFSTNSMTNCPEDLLNYNGGIFVFIDHNDGSEVQAIKILSGSLNFNNNQYGVYSGSFTFDLSTVYNNLTSGTNILTFGIQESFFNGKRYTHQYNPLTVVVGSGGQSNPDVIYVDGFDGETGGLGSENFPFHSLKKVLTNSANAGKQIMLLPGKYTFTENINLYDRDFTLTALGEVNFTSTRALFNKNPLGDVTFNGINFVDIVSSSSAVLNSESTFIQNGIGTINFNNCSFIANTAKNLIESSCNVNIKGCTFIDNEATGTSIQDGGLIENHFTDSSTIDISYSIFVNNKIAEVNYNGNSYNPIIVDANNGNGPAVKFNYNFVDNNDGLANAGISNNARITSNGYTKITPTAHDISVGNSQDIFINFTKSNGGALNGYMPDLNVTLAPTVNFNSIPIAITKNSGKGEYVAISPANPESVDVKVGNNVINTFTFVVTGNSNLKDPNLVVSDSLAVNVTLNGTISVSRDGNGAISFVSADESVATVDNTGKVTGVSQGNTTITVYVATDGEYSPALKKVNVTVSLLSPNLVINPDSLTIEEGSEAYITVSRDGNGAISFVSDNESIANEVSYGSLHAIQGNSPGNAIITVNVASNGNYAAQSKKINVTVKRPVYASIYYVDSSIAKEGNGSDGSTYKTIEAAIAAANDNFDRKGTGTIIIKEGTNGVYAVASTIDVNRNMAIKADDGADVTITSSFDGSIFRQNTKLDVDLIGLTFRDINITDSNAAIYYQSYNVYDGILNVLNCSFINNQAPNLVRLYKTNATFKYDCFIQNTATAGDSDGGLINFASGGSQYNNNSYKFDVSYSNIVNNTCTCGYIFAISDSAHQLLYVNNNYWGSNKKPANVYNRQEYTNLENFVILKFDVDNDVKTSDEQNLTLKFTLNGTEFAPQENLPDLSINLSSKGSFKPMGTIISKNNAEDIITYKAPKTPGIDTIFVKYGEYTLNTADVNVAAKPDPNLVVMPLTIRVTCNGTFNITHLGDGAISYAILSGEDIISIDENGLVSGLKRGNATVCVTIEETSQYATNSTNVTVSVIPLIKTNYTTTPSPSEINYVIGQSQNVHVESEFNSTISEDLGEYYINVVVNGEVARSVCSANQTSFEFDIFNIIDKLAIGINYVTFEISDLTLIDQTTFNRLTVNASEPLVKTDYTITPIPSETDYTLGDEFNVYGITEFNQTFSKALGMFDVYVVVNGEVAGTVGKANETIIKFDLKRIADKLVVGINDISFELSANPLTNLTTFNKLTVNASKPIQTEILLDISDIKFNESALVNVTLPSGAGGNITVLVDGREVTTKTAAGGLNTIPLSDLSCGKHVVEVRYSGDGYYPPQINKTEITVNKLTSILTAEGITAGEDATVVMEITVTDGASGVVFVDIGGNKYFGDIKDGKTSVNVVGLTPGNYAAVITYEGDEKFNGSSTTADVNITAKEKPAKANVIITTVDGGISVELPDDATGDVIVKIDGREIYNGSAKESIIIPLANIVPGSHIVEAAYSGDNKYDANLKTDEITLLKFASEVSAKAIEMVEGESSVLEVTVTENATGVIFVDVGGNKYFGEINGGTAKVTIAGLAAGNHTAVITYDGDDYFNGSQTHVDVNVTAKEPVVISKDKSRVFARPMEFIEGEPAVIDVTVTDGATGVVLLNIGDNKYYGDIKDGKAKINVIGLTPGSYVALISYGGDDKFEGSSSSVSVKIIAKQEPVTPELIDSNMNITVAKVNVGEDAEVSVQLPEDAAGYVVVQVDAGKLISYNVTGGSVDISLGKLSAGNHSITVVYSGDDKYNVSSAIEAITVEKLTAFVSSDSVEVSEGETAIVTVTVESAATGIVLVDIDGAKFYGDIKDGKATVNVIGLAAGNYTAALIYGGDDRYMPANANVSVKIIAKEDPAGPELVNPNMNITVSDVKLGEDAKVSVQLPEDAYGNVIVFVDGKDIAGLIVSGGSVDIPMAELTAGNHIVEVRYSGSDKYASDSNIKEITVDKLTAAVSADSVEVSEGETAKITVSVDSNATGVVLVDVAGNRYYADIANGSAAVDVVGLTAGDYTAEVTYMGDDNYARATGNATVKVNAKAAPKALSSIAIAEVNGNAITGILKDGDGKGIAGAEVKYTAKGITKSAITKADGSFVIEVQSNVPVNIVYAGDNNTEAADSTITITEKAIPTFVKAAAAFNIPGNSITINGYAVDTAGGEQGMTYMTGLFDANGKPISGVDIQFAVNNKIYNRTTLKNGSMDKPYHLDMKRAGRYTMAFSFGGNDNYNSTFAVVCIDLDKKPIKIKAGAKSYKVSTKIKKYTVKLSTIVGSSLDGKAHLRSGLKVTLTVNGKTYTGKTNSKGQVTFKINNLSKKAKYIAKISYEGDMTYESATKKVKLTVK